MSKLMWICSKCGRRFSKKNQIHSCENNYSVDAQFQNKAEHVRNLYDFLFVQISGFGDLYIEPVQSAIMFKRKTTFLAVKVKKNSLQLEYFSDSEDFEVPVFKCVQTSKSRYAHIAMIYDELDLSRGVFENIKQSFTLCS